MKKNKGLKQQVSIPRQAVYKVNKQDFFQGRGIGKIEDNRG